MQVMTTPKSEVRTDGKALGDPAAAGRIPFIGSDNRPLREVFGEALIQLGRANPRVVVLDADLSEATKSVMFKKAFPDRFYNIGIAEANMVCIAAGFSTTGHIPFACTFAFLLALRAADQIRSQVCYPEANVKLVGTNGGLTGFGDGATHQCTKDLAIMRAMPNLTVVVPSDAVTVTKAVFAAAEHVGPLFLRIPRVPNPIVHDPEVEFRIGKGYRLREGSDLTIVANGMMVSRALEAASRLAAEGTQVEVLEIHTLKPFDETLVIDSAVKTGAVVTVEEHSRYGGLFSAVSETLSMHHPVPMEYVAVEDRFGESGVYEQILERCGLTPEKVVEKARKVLQRKKAGRKTGTA
jgi:transketolase